MKCFFFALVIFFEQGVMRLSVGEMYLGFLDRCKSYEPDEKDSTYMLFAIFFARRALAPIPGAALVGLLVALPRGA